jgi:hypothetical protein
MATTNIRSTLTAESVGLCRPIEPTSLRDASSTRQLRLCIGTIGQQSPAITG